MAPEIPALRTETTAGRPLRLNTGRVRDQWHTMTRTGLSPRLGQHLPEPFVEVHPVDAARFGLSHDGFARVTTDYGQCILKVTISPRQQRGMLFAPIHWSEHNASSGRVGGLVAPFTDPFSGQPENKATPASIVPYEYVFRGFVLSRTQLQMPTSLWWARAAVKGGFGYLFADNADLMRWPAWLQATAAADIAEYRDFGGGVYRAASFVGDRIETCLFVGPARDAGDWEVVKSMFALESPGQRSAPDAVVRSLRRRCREFRADRVRLLRCRQDGDRRRDRAGRKDTGGDRGAVESRNQLRLVHPGDEAADRAGGRGGATRTGRHGELRLSTAEGERTTLARSRYLPKLPSCTAPSDEG